MGVRLWDGSHFTLGGQKEMAHAGANASKFLFANKKI